MAAKSLAAYITLAGIIMAKKRKAKKKDGKIMSIRVWVPNDLGKLRIAYVAAWETNKTFLRSLQVLGVD